MVDDNSTFLIERDGHMDIVADDWYHALALVRALQPSRDKPIAIDRIWSSGERDWGHKWWFFTPDDIDEVMWDAPDAKWEC
jgi:hypothetical protein